MQEWAPFDALIRKLLHETLRSDGNRGGIDAAVIPALESAFTAANSYDEETCYGIKLRALAYILRARHDAGLQGQPELEGRYEDERFFDVDGPLSFETLYSEEAVARYELLVKAGKYMQ